MSLFYPLNLIGFATVNAYLLHKQYQRVAPKTTDDPPPCPPSRDNDDDDGAPEAETALLNRPERSHTPSLTGHVASRFVWDYFPAYALAVAADWIQGPHIYAIYKYDKHLPERLVATLYATGFVAGAVSATFAGRLSDSYGRRVACLAYCAMYVITCASMLSDSVAVLFVGRLAGGTATTLLFSVFDAWMIAEFRERGTAAAGREGGVDEESECEEGEGLTLGLVLSYATTLSSLVAIAMGVFGDFLVGQVGGRTGPFMAGIACCLGAAMWIWCRWGENYGDASPDEPTTPSPSLLSILTDRKVLVLMLVTTAFESSMYLFVFFWSAALQSAHGTTASLPFGLVFACFMCAMMAGSSLLSLARPSSQRSATNILAGVILAASLGLCTASAVRLEALLFYAFVLVEAAVGAYYPVIGLVKSEVVQDRVRGSVYSLMRLPLNVFVVVVHSLDEEGDGHRNRVFLLLAAFLAIPFLAIWRTFR